MPLSQLQFRVVQSLLIERSISAVAIVCECTPRAIQKWLKDDLEFQKELRLARAQCITQIATQVAGAASILTRRLHELSDNPNLDVGSTCDLIKFVLPFAVQLNDREQLLSRIAELEADSTDKLQTDWHTIEGLNGSGLLERDVQDSAD